VTAFRLRDALIAVAAFLIVMAVLTYIVVAQRFVGSWPVSDTVITSTAASSTYLDPADLDVQRDAQLTRRRNVNRTVSAVPGADAYVVSTSTITADDRVVRRQRWAAVQDPATGSAIDSPANAERITTFNGSGDGVESQRRLPSVQGQLLRFPRDTEARSYRRWDPETRRTGDATFVRQTRLAGADVLVFRQVETAGPSASDDGAVISSDTTLWVRPEVGGVVKTSTQVTVTARGSGTPTLEARFVDDADSIRRASAAVDRAVDRDRLHRLVIPGVTLLAGILAAFAAVLEGRTGRLEGRLRGRQEEGS